MNVQTISEDFLHYVWKFKCFNFEELSSTTNQKIQIVHQGFQNFNAGPDFSNAKILIENTQWIGNIEIHIKSSDWDKHKHSLDPSYASIILHIVHTHDRDIPFLVERNILTLELGKLIDKDVFKRYLSLQNSGQKILCANEIHKVSPLIISNTMGKLGVERIQNKTEEIKRIFKFTKGNWEDTFYFILAKYYGAKVNSDPFERLARSIPLSLIQKLKNQNLKIEALFYGQSGLLPIKTEEPYPLSLIREYNFLKKKHKLTPLPIGVWKFARMRPVSFPTIRIALFVDLLITNDHLFSKILELKDANSFRDLFKGKTHSFWDDHYQFKKESVFKPKKMGADSIDMILINVIAPFMFFYGCQTDQQNRKDQAVRLLESIKAEKNSVTQSWHEIGVIAGNALDSQAQLELKRSYCDLKRCVECSIGHQIMSND